MTLKYIGNGAFIPDLKGELVPSRDLTDQEVAHFGKDALLKSGLYEEVGGAKAENNKFNSANVSADKEGE